MSAPRPPRVFRANEVHTGRGTENTMFDEVLSAIEWLETRGWELVNLDQGFVACMRRR